MEVLIVLVLGLALAVALSVAAGVRYARATSRAAATDGTAHVLAQLDATTDRTVVTWPAAWGRPTVADVTRAAVARGWAIEAQTVADGEHILTLRRA